MENTATRGAPHPMAGNDPSPVFDDKPSSRQRQAVRRTLTVWWRHVDAARDWCVRTGRLNTGLCLT